MASSGHAENYATRFVLGDGMGARLLHFEHPFRTVVAHAGHDDAHHIAAAITRRRAKQDVHRRPVPADQRPVAQFDVISRAAALQQQMPVARSDQRLTTE